MIAAARLADDLVFLFLEDLLEVETDDRLVLGNDDTDGVTHQASLSISPDGGRPIGSELSALGWDAGGSARELLGGHSIEQCILLAFEVGDGTDQGIALAAEGVGVTTALAGLGVREWGFGDQRP